jgi:AmiR/NasT family two-component response regulator
LGGLFSVRFPFNHPAGRLHQSTVVPDAGLEPARPYEQSILSAPRLPFRQSGAQQRVKEYRRLDPVTDQEQPSIAPRRVVVAEDESLIRMDIVEILRDNGFEVVGEAGDGETAVALATELRPDLVIMDVKMPQLDGISAAERLTKNHIAPVVLLTAFSQKELVERASEAGALAYVVKPFTPSDLLPAIEIALSRYSQIITLEAEVADLVERFETRKLVDRAKGLLNEKMGLSEPEAFRWIQKASMDRRLTMHDVAQAIIEQLSAKK